MLAALLVTLALFVGVSTVRSTRARARRAAAASRRALAADTLVSVHGIVQGRVVRAVSRERTQELAPDQLRRRIAALAPGTYIGDILAEQDSALYRWPAARGEPLRVHLQTPVAGAAGDPAYLPLVEAVFEEWRAAGFPRPFTFILDSASADITVTWRDRFSAEEGQRIGMTDRRQTSSFAIAHAAVQIALHDSAGRPFTPATVAGIVRHEVGHALGLNHAEDPSSVMYRESATTALAPSDRATLRLLYSVPGGSVR